MQWDPSWPLILSVAALILSVLAVLLCLLLLTRLLRRRQNQTLAAPVNTPPGPPAFVVNPTKVADLAHLRELVTRVSAELDLPAPLWLETSVDDPGAGQTKQALARGAAVVVAAGGDGTVREVAGALAGTGVPLGLLPLGTGNLYARNLDLPIEDPTELIRTALAGSNHAVDIGYLHAEGVDHAFLVMGGVGIDARMVADADEGLKARLGWFAYFFSGARHLSHRVHARITVGSAAPVDHQARTLLVANCGRLPGGIVLLPDAELDDGWLDIAALDTRAGPIGWASLFGRVVLQGIGIRSVPAPAKLTFWRGKEVSVELTQAEPIQVDGDVVGESDHFRARVAAGALLVRSRGTHTGQGVGA